LPAGAERVTTPAIPARFIDKPTVRDQNFLNENACD
jgi:hypothetical protein